MLTSLLLQAAAEYVLSLGASAWSILVAGARDVFDFARDNAWLLGGGAFALLLAWRFLRPHR